MMKLRHAFKLVLLVAITFPALGVIVATDKHEEQNEAATTEELLETRYQAWREWCNTHPFSSDLTGCAEFQKIVDLGVAAVPLLIDKIKTEPDGFFLSVAVRICTRKGFPRDAYPNGLPGGGQADAKLLIQWWDVDRKNTRQAFEQAYAGWNESKQHAERIYGHPILWTSQAIYDGSDKEIRVIERHRIQRTAFGEAYFTLCDLGIDILPLIIEQIRQGNYDLLPVFGELTRGKGVLPASEVREGREVIRPLDERVRFTLDWWETNKSEWIIPDTEVHGN